MPSFDIISEINIQELRHAVENATREMTTRFDFRGVESSIDLKELVVTLRAESDFQVRQLEDLFRAHAVKRGIDTSGVTIEDAPVHSGKMFSLNMTFQQGIDKDYAKQIIKQIKDAKAKVQTSIQGEKIRVTGKKRDDLQECIAILKKSDIDLPLQFENFRD
jgi:hypothetical protein